MIILVHPPLTKSCEPPAGVARLYGFLNAHNLDSMVIDANLEGILSLLAEVKDTSDTWTRRAVKNLKKHLNSLAMWPVYQNMSRYSRAVMDINRVLHAATKPYGVKGGLGNYQDIHLSPVRSQDLIRASETFDKNPFYPYFQKRFLDILEKKEPEIIGFSLNYLNQALCTFAMLGFLKKVCPGVRLVLGGGLVTSWVKRPGFKNPFYGLVDDLVDGHGEVFFSNIFGVDHTSPDNLPDYGLFLNKPYLSPGFVLPYSASSGCYWKKCSFCPEQAEDNPYQPIAADKAVSDIRFLVQKTRPSLIHLLDNAVSPVLLKEIIKNNINTPWYGFVRVSNHFLDLDFCLALKNAGCIMLKLGIESGDQDVLDQMQKGIDLDIVSSVLKNLKKAGIATYVYLLFGTPWEKHEQACNTMGFTVHNSEHIDFLNIAVFNLPAFGPDVEKLNISPFYDGDLSLYSDFLHPHGWDRLLVRKFLDRTFKKHPAVAKILRRDPPVFTSNHASFFKMESREI